MRIRIFRDAEALASAAAEEIAGWLRFDEQPTIGLAGGTTPSATYTALAQESVPWAKVHVWVTDERHVPPNAPDSNAAMARAAFFDQVPATFHEVPFDADDPSAAASEYERTLHGVLPVGTGGVTPGLVLLGVGVDGHTASLFPGTDALRADHRGFVANWVPPLDAWRLTATMPMLAAARRTMFLISGEEKAQIVHEILDLEVDHPAARLSKAARDAVWLLDREAASGLERTS